MFVHVFVLVQIVVLVLTVLKIVQLLIRLLMVVLDSQASVPSVQLAVH